MTSLKTSIKTITYLSDIGCLEIQGASLDLAKDSPDAKQELLERLLSGKRMTGRDEMDIKRILKTKEALDNIRNFIDKQQLTNNDTPKKSTVPNEDKKGIR